MKDRFYDIEYSREVGQGYHEICCRHIMHMLKEKSRDCHRDRSLTSHSFMLITQYSVELEEYFLF